MDPSPKRCEWCASEYVPKQRKSDQRFCTSRCKNLAHSAAKSAALRTSRVGIVCIGCGKSIADKVRSTKWCSEACAMRQRTPELRRKYRLFSKYGITPGQYDEMVVLQGGVCAICGGDDPKTKHGFWHIDHCHESNIVRGLLCSTCNTGLGSFFDRPDWLRRAADYVAAHP